MNRSKNEPLEPSARNQLTWRRRDAGAVVAGGEDAAVDGHVHRALDQDRHAVGRDDRGRDVGATAASARSAGRPTKPVSLSMLMVRAAARADGVGLGDRPADRAQEGDGHRGRAGVRVLQQVVEIEGAGGGAFGEVPGRRRLLDRRLGVAAEAVAVPGHRAVDDHRLVALDRGREGDVLEAGDRLGVDRGAAARGDRQDLLDLGAGVALEAQHHGGEVDARIEQRDAIVEERAGRSFGEEAGEVAGRMRVVGALLGVGEAVAIRIRGGVVAVRVGAELRLPVVVEAVAVGVDAGEAAREAVDERVGGAQRAGRRIGRGAGGEHAADAVDGDAAALVVVAAAQIRGVGERRVRRSRAQRRTCRGCRRCAAAPAGSAACRARTSGRRRSTCRTAFSARARPRSLRVPP